MSKTPRAIGTATAGTSSLSRETTSGALSPRDLRGFRVSHLLCSILHHGNRNHDARYCREPDPASLGQIPLPCGCNRKARESVGSGTTPEKPYQNRPALLKGPCEGFCVEREACC